MAFGITVKNNAGKTVFNTTDPVLQVLAKGETTLDNWVSDSTSTGFCNATATSDWGDSIDCNIHQYLPLSESNGEFYFFRLLLGQRVHCRNRKGDLEIYSNFQTVRWVRCRFARFISPEPTDTFGMRIQDGQGRLVYHSGARLVHLEGTLQNHSGNGFWVAPTTSPIYRHDDSIPYLPGAYRDGNGNLFAQGWTCGAQYQAFTGYTYAEQRIRGLVADINYGMI